MQPGTQLAHYEILSAIGKGGMGEVWRARDTKLGREVAIKTLPLEFAGDAERVARLEREATLLASLNHPNIAAVYGFETFEATRFLVLELVEGDTLAERIRRTIPVEEALRLALQIAQALEAAHQRGVVHRDLKPANIKVTPEGNVKVLDFGLAKAFTGGQADVSTSNAVTRAMTETQQGVILGTAAYMSPEQARGVEVDQRADIWAFGCVLFEMLTRRPAFGGKTPSDILAAVLQSEPDWTRLPARLHFRIRLLLERCLDSDLRYRYHDIADARVDIEKVLADPDGVQPQGVPEVQTKLPWLGMVLGVIVAGVAVWVFREDTPRPVTRFSHVLEEQVFTPSVTRNVLAVSPDGSRFVYVANQQLYLRAMNALESTPIPGTDEDPTSPFFSPDGEWIGYWSPVDSQLKKIAASGGTPVRISDSENPYGAPSWGEDDRIVWSQSEGIMGVSANGGFPEQLVAASAGETLVYPRALPDGETLLFNTGLPNAGFVTVHSVESEDRKVLTEGVSPRYLPTGHLVYGVDDVLFGAPFDLATLAITGPAVPLVERVQTGFLQYSVSDSGSLVYLQALPTGLRSLAFADRNGNFERLDMSPKPYSSPRISPDGQRVAVQSVETNGESHIWTYDLAGNAAMQQLTLEGNNQRPVWTPDSQRITFASDSEGTLSIYWKLADGSGVADRLTSAEEGIEHRPESWSPDGRTLSFSVVHPEGMDVWTVSPDSTAPEAFAAIPGTSQEFGSVFSPDGNWLAYGSGSPGQAEIYVEPFPSTGERRRVSQELGAFPLWSPDGRELFYRSLAAERAGTLRRIAISTEPSFTFSPAQPLPIENFLTFSYYRSFDITPDGERFLVVLPADQPDSGESEQPKINIVLNWSQELLERVPVP